METEEGDMKGKRPKGTSPSGKSNKLALYHFQEEQ